MLCFVASSPFKTLISIYTPLSADAICFYADSEIKMDIEKYDILSPSTVNLDDLAGKVVR